MSFNSTFVSFNNTTENSNTTEQKSTNFPRATATLIGVIFACFCVLGIISNIVSTRITFVHRKYLNSSSTQFMILSILGLLGSILLIPLNIIASFDKDFVLGDAGCKPYGFFFTFIGLLYITTYTVSIIQSYRIIVTNTIKSIGFDWGPTLCVLGSCVVICGIIAVLPLIGISEYHAVRTPILCHIRWKSFSTVDMSFSILTLVLFFLVPVTVVVVLYVAIYKKVDKGPNLSNMHDQRIVYMLNTFIISAGIFMLSWTPYSILATLETFGTMDYIGASSVQIAASLVAKLSMTWTPTVYLVRHRHFQKEYREMKDALSEITSRCSGSYNLLNSPGRNTTSKISGVELADMAIPNVRLLKVKILDDVV